jgi:SAM-dependent methyltransferase
LIFIVFFGLVLLWQGSRQTQSYYSSSSSSYSSFDLPHVLAAYPTDTNPAATSPAASHMLLGVPAGTAVALPNLRQTNDEVELKRTTAHFGGQGDSSHLGGFVPNGGIDMKGISPHVWKRLVTDFNLKSVLDLGCGRGFSTSWFWTHGLRTRCVDGSADAFYQSAIPLERKEELLVAHDYTLGPWWPEETYDAVWSVEFMENVGIHHMKNYLPTLRKAALVFMTSARWGGWHHVEVHDDKWWIRKMESFGFRYSEDLTSQVRTWGKQEVSANLAVPFVANSTYNAQHIWLTMKVFVNPTVASLPEHDHLFFEEGCFAGRVGGNIRHRECGEAAEESKVPVSYYPLQMKSDMDREWERLMVNALQPGKSPTPPAVRHTSSELPEIMQRVQQRNFTNLPIIPVVAWPYVTTGVQTAEHKHVEENGINESPLLRLSQNLYDVDPNVVWVGDTGYGAGWNLWCEEFLRVINNTQVYRAEHGFPLKWPIYIVDFTDQASLQRCKNVERFMGREYVYYATRSMGKDRRWDSKRNWVRMGHLLETKLRDGTSYRHIPLVVRTDTIVSLQATLKRRGHDLTYPIETYNRSTDVIHLWPMNESKKVNYQYGFLRTEVSNLTIQIGNKHNLSTFVGLAGKPLREGRRDVEDAYIEQLLDTKIVALAQRDFWEDHYRLLEAVVSGACVLHDFMFGLPAGLEDGKSIVLYRSAKEFEEKILYYLQHDEERMEIGRRGREIAMSRHRSWHRMEEVIFGERLTSCGPKKPTSPCPFIVHGDETR